MNINNQIQYTTIGQTFNLELMFIKVCGGFMFDASKINVNILYRLAIIIVARFLNFRHHSRFPKEFESFSKAAWQNVRLFWFSYNLIAHATVFVTLFTGIKYHRLVSVILNKRFDTRYLSLEETTVAAVGDCAAGNGSGHCGSSSVEMDNRIRVKDRGSNAAQTTISGGGDIPPSGDARKVDSADLALAGSGNSNTNGINTITSSSSNNNNNNHHHHHDTEIRSLRVRIVRNFLIANVLLTTLSSFLGDQTHARFRSNTTLPRQLPPNSTTSTSIGSSSSPSWSAIPIFITPPLIRSQHQLHIPSRQNQSAGRATPGGGSSVRRHCNHHCVHHNASHSRSPFSWVKRFWLSRWPDEANSNGTSNNFLPAIVRRNILILGYILFAFIQAALDINQTYGQLYVVLMVTAALTDMLNYSCAHDGLISRKELDKLPNNNNNINISYDKYKIGETPQQQHQTDAPTNNVQWSDSQRRPLLTTALLVQARDVLLVLRCAMGLDYLMLLIFEMARLMNVFCMFNAAITTGRIDTILLICLDYISIAFSMSLTRLGYHWLHNRVRKLKRMVDETNLLLNNGDKSINSNNSSSSDNTISASAAQDNNEDDHQPMVNSTGRATTTGLSQSEMITTYRLADYIESLWPTDWFTPDIKGYLRHTIFVITFVATLQQLVEAGSRVEYHLNNDQDEIISSEG